MKSGNSSVVERQFPKLKVAGSIPVFRSRKGQDIHCFVLFLLQGYRDFSKLNCS
jgi:hypothetical protein